MQVCVGEGTARPHTTGRVLVLLPPPKKGSGMLESKDSAGEAKAISALHVSVQV